MNKFERNKDLAQEIVASTAEHVGEIAKIITGAVVGVTRQIGEIASDAFEMREAAKRAQLDEERSFSEPVHRTAAVDAEIEPETN